MRTDEEILAGCYSKEVIIKGSGGIPDKIMQHAQFKPVEGAAAQLEVLLDIRRILVDPKLDSSILETKTKKKVKKV